MFPWADYVDLCNPHTPYVRRILLCTIISIIPVILSSQVIYVDATNSNSDQDGLSWETAFTDLSKALDGANKGAVLWIAEGTYYPDPTKVDRDQHFTLPTGVTMLGGFQGNETLESERDSKVFVTVLSGDIGIPEEPSDNSYTVLFIEGADENTLVDGFTIVDGNANFADELEPFRSPRLNGGAIYLYTRDSTGAPRISNCTLLNNSAKQNGGAIYINTLGAGIQNSIIEDCDFRNNSAVRNGGAIAIDVGKKPPIVNRCFFTQNSALHGGAISTAIDETCVFAIRNSEFLDNNAAIGLGSSVWMDRLVLTGQISIEHCTFSSDSSHLNAGTKMIYLRDFSPQFVTDMPFAINIHDCMFDSPKSKRDSIYIAGNAINIETYGSIDISITESHIISTSIWIHNKSGPVLIDGCTFRNSTGADPALSIYTQNQSHISNTHFVNNIGSLYGVAVFGSHNSTWTNCNISNNASERTLISSDRTINFWNTIVSDNTILTSDPYNSWSAIKCDSFNFDYCLTDLSQSELISAAAATNVLNMGEHNIFNRDPLFIDAGEGDFRLKSCSPAINAGSNDWIAISGLQTDAYQNDRIIDSIVDIGPYEHLQPFNLTLQEILPVTCFGLSDGSIEVDYSGVSPEKLAWTSSNGNSGSTLSQLAAGVYNIIFSDGDLCLDSLILEVTEPPKLLVEANWTNVKCFGTSTGSANAIIEGGSPPYELQWSNGSENASIEELLPGTYSLVVTDNNACNEEISILIDENPLIGCIVEYKNPTTNIFNNGNLSLASISGGIPPYTFVWEDNSSDSIRTSLGAGDYTINITDSENCVISKTVKLTAINTIDELSIRSWPNPIDSQSPLIIEVTTPNDIEFSWQIYDVSGKSLWGEQKEEVSLGVQLFSYDIDFPSGAYILAFFVDQQFQFAQALVVTNK